MFNPPELLPTDRSAAAESPQEQPLSSGRKPLIAIDGPAGAGKSTVARRVAAQLGLLYLDTGAMYRALTWLALEKGIPLDNQAQLTELSQQAQIRLNTQAGQQPTVGTQVWVNGIEVTTQIRSTQVTQAVSRVSAWPGVRRAMVELQRQIGQAGGVVLEGRDIGTAVFPNAELKIFLTASPRQRAQRRQRELLSQGVDVDLGSLQEQIQSRDQQDSQRTVAPLKKADDAVVIDSDALTIEQVQAEIVALYQNL
ncbi:MAG: (d)CMP kinase [Synechococcaceae cyanobacterium SM2_3_2]|nr:(d)CMP kinase [Synechococcaceae cyanobacterium SM2_3_2]